MSDSSHFQAVIERIEEDKAVLSIQPVGRIEIPLEYLPSEAEEGARLHFEVIIDAEGSQYIKKAPAEEESSEEEEAAYEYSDDVA